jgi:hypothetical protein
VRAVAQTFNSRHVTTDMMFGVSPERCNCPSVFHECMALTFATKRALWARSVVVAGCVILLVGCRDTAPTSPVPSLGRSIEGRLVAAGDVGSLARVRVTLRTQHDGVAREFSGLADDGGTFRFNAELPAGTADSVDLIVSSDDALPPFAPIYKRVAASDSSAYRRPLLIARNVVIPSGTYAGSRVAVSLEDAFTPICADSTSASCLAYFGLWQTVPVLWPEDAYPIPMAFFRRAGATEITADDSAAFWANVAVLEAEFGRDLFRPVDVSALGAVTPAGLPERGNAVSLDPAAAPALAGAWVQNGRLVFARTRASTNQWLRQRYVMNHELIHVLGFGHTCSWESLMCGVSAGRQSATRGDIAGFVLAYLIDKAVRAEAPTTTLADALLGEKMVSSIRR